MSNPSSLHDRVVGILFELCEEYETNSGRKRYDEVQADHIGQEYRPIVLTSMLGKKPLAMKYSPDVWARVRGKNLYDVCEVWHSETEAEATEDILFSALLSGIRYLHIVCTGENLTRASAERRANFILSKIRNGSGKRFLDPQDGVLITEIPRKMWKDDSKIKRLLKEELEF